MGILEVWTYCIGDKVLIVLSCTSWPNTNPTYTGERGRRGWSLLAIILE